jgi:hypothetical protein
MNDETALTALFDSVDIGTPPPASPDDPERLLRLGRRSVRRRRLAGGLAAVAVLVGATLAVPPAVRYLDSDRVPLNPGQNTGQPSLPDQFARRSVFTNDVDRAPAGRAIALYTYGNAELFQDSRVLVVGADADTYRRVPAVEDRSSSHQGEPSALLSPDGTRVAVGSNDVARDLLLVDLTTGHTREYPAIRPASLKLLAWSPDGRYVAYRTSAPLQTGQVPDDNCPLTTDPNDDEYAGSELAVLDLDTGQSTGHPELGSVCRAAYGPDGRLAVQAVRTIDILATSGARERQFPVPDNFDLVPGVAWSPDGTRLAASSLTDQELEFLDPTGARATVQPALRLPRQSAYIPVLGWRSATTLLLQDWGGNADGSYDNGSGRYESTIAEVPIDGSPGQVIATFSTATDCEFGTQDCMVNDLHLATGLIGQLTIRRAGPPERGPWPQRVVSFTIVAAGILIIGGTATTGLILRRRRRRRPAGPVIRSGVT